jgi:hypothetical protein
VAYFNIISQNLRKPNTTKKSIMAACLPNKNRSRVFRVKEGYTTISTLGDLDGFCVVRY